MPQEFTITCPQCSTEYDVPIEYIGEIAQCPKCEHEFKIPSADKGKNLHETTTLDKKVVDQIFKTTKLSRKTYGMIPELDERKKFFNFNNNESEQVKPGTENTPTSPNPLP